MKKFSLVSTPLGCHIDPTVYNYSTKFEYRVLVDAILKLLWLHWLLIDIGASQ